VKLLRWFILLVVALAALAALVAFDPWAQTLIAQSWLNRQPGLRGTVESVSARWTQVTFTDLRLKSDGATLIFPTLTVGVPVKDALLEARYPVHQLVAKGWTLDLASRPTAAAGGKADAAARSAPGLDASAPAESVSPGAQFVRQVMVALHSLLTATAWEREISCDGVDLEGDVRLPATRGEPPRWLHVSVRGGGLAAGREGEFALQISELNAPKTDTPFQGRLWVRMDATRAINRIRLETTVPPGAKSALPAGLSVALEADNDRRVGDETYALKLRRSDRDVLVLQARRQAATGELAGTWQLDARDEDRAAFTRLPATFDLVASGGGSFSSDGAFTRVQLSGRASAVVNDRATSLAKLGPVSAAAQFELALQGQVLRLAQFNATVTGTKPLAAFTLRAPVEFDPQRREFRVAEPQADWLEISLQGLPLAVVPALPAPWRIAGGEISGDATVSGTAGSLLVKTRAPLTAGGVILTRDGKVWGEGLDVTAGVEAKWTSSSWQLQWSPFTVTHDGQPLFSSTGQVIPSPTPGRPATLKGTLRLEVDALALQPIGRELGHLPGRTLSAEFSTQVGAWNALTAKIALAGRNPLNTASTSLTADLDRSGRITFLAPLQIALGKATSEITAEGTWTTGATPRFGVKLISARIDLDQLRPLAGPAAWLVGARAPSDSTSPVIAISGPRVGSTPFWGTVPGWLALQFDKVRVSGRDYDDVGGTVTVEPASLRLEGGHAQQRPYNPVKLDGEVTFKPGADSLYELKASAALNGLESARLLPMPESNQALVWEGKYSASVTTTSAGRDFDELWRRRSDDFRFSANAGIVRLLGVQLADAMPQQESKTRERAGAVAEALGEIFKIRPSNNEDKIEIIPNAISSQAEKVLNFTYRVREIPFTKLEVSAFRTADGTVHLNDILIASDQEYLTGTGRIDGGDGLLTQRPMHLDLKLALRGSGADAVAETGLLSEQTNAEGYTRIAAPIALGGTLVQIDAAAWREFLVQLALRPSPAAKHPAPDPAANRRKKK
jgi:hypothetical protein